MSARAATAAAAKAAAAQRRFRPWSGRRSCAIEGRSRRSRMATCSVLCGLVRHGHRREKHVRLWCVCRAAWSHPRACRACVVRCTRCSVSGLTVWKAENVCQCTFACRGPTCISTSKVRRGPAMSPDRRRCVKTRIHLETCLDCTKTSRAETRSACLETRVSIQRRRGSRHAPR